MWTSCEEASSSYYKLQSSVVALFPAAGQRNQSFIKVNQVKTNQSVIDQGPIGDRSGHVMS